MTQSFPLERNGWILLIVVEPESFTRDRVLALARQLNQDFPYAQRLYAVLFDGVDAERDYAPPVGSHYSRSKKLERGEYRLDRARRREAINFSSRRGNPVNEIQISLSGRGATVRKKKVVAPRQRI